jgi:hypothetical protein
MTSRPAGLAAALVCAAAVVHGQPIDPPPTAEPNWSWGIDFEQDSELMPKTDEDYTQGTEIALGGWKPRRAPILRYGFDALAWLDRGFDAVEGWVAPTPFRRACPKTETSRSVFVPQCEGVAGESVYVTHQFSFGVSGFTPRKGYPGVEGDWCTFRGCVLALTERVFEDRPYASLTYVQFERTKARGRVAYSSNLTAGALGLQIGKVVQTAIHDDQTDPGGWRHQISNRGEPTAAYAATLKVLTLAVPLRSARPEQSAQNEYWDASQPRRRYLDLTLDAGPSVGFYTRLAGGATLRVGYIKSAFWANDREPIQYTIAAPQQRNRAPAEFFVFGTLGGSLWGYNALMQGQFKDSTVTLDFDPESGPNVSSPLRRWVGQWSVGVRGILPIGKTTALSLGGQRHFLSPTFDVPHSRDHGYWGAYIRVLRGR